MKRFNRMIKSFYPMLGSVVMLLAVYGGVRPASWWQVYQMKTPKCLK